MSPLIPAMNCLAKVFSVAVQKEGKIKKLMIRLWLKAHLGMGTLRTMIAKATKDRNQGH